MPTLLRVLLLAALPIIAFVGGGALMMRHTGRDHVRAVLDNSVRNGTLTKADSAHLNMRWREGYDREAFRRYWNALDDKARGIEERFLEFDLVFPFLYGGALAASLLMAWAALGRPVHPAWVLLPVLILVAADWTENLVQLGQVRRWNAGGDAALQAGWIGVASAATRVKCAFIGVTALMLVGLLVWNLVAAVRAPRTR
ncbi:MAG TPA: hypothetical protein VFS20_04635 [Longimicrobium sp.]|nr:hypothetical protein [Longimicrobium sp.]